ncbi:MAG: tetratricopeptide repeat protein [Bacteroidales bacterium]
MRRFFFILFAIIGFSSFVRSQAPPQTQQGITSESVEKRLEKSNSRIEQEKHRQKSKTWVDRGIVFQDIFDVNIQFLYFGMTEDELRLFMGDPDEVRTEETETGTRDVLVYENINIFFENGQLTGWEETEKIHEAPLEEAYSSFQKAIEIEETGEDPGFFQRIFSGNQERRIQDAYLRLHGQFISQAVLEYENSEYEAAFNSFKSSVEIADSPYYEEPLDTSLVFNTGFVASLAGKHEEAIEYLSRAKEMGYEEGNVYVLIKDSYTELGDSTRAEQVLQEGFEAFPNDNAILVELVNFYINSDNAEAALNYLQLAKEQEPENPSFHFAEGMLYERMGDPETAKEAYQRSIDLNPEFFDANYNMGVLYYNEAVKMLEEANELTDNVEYEKARDEAFEALDKSIPYLEKAHVARPEDQDTMETLRILYYRLGYEEKLEEMNRKLGREGEE